MIGSSLYVLLSCNDNVAKCDKYNTLLEMVLTRDEGGAYVRKERGLIITREQGEGAYKRERGLHRAFMVCCSNSEVYSNEYDEDNLTTYLRRVLKLFLDLVCWCQ